MACLHLLEESVRTVPADFQKERIILPKSFFTTLDRMNKILAEGGSDKKWTAEDYVKEQFNKAIKETMLRAEDKVVK